MPRRYRKQSIRCAIETIYGVSADPTAADVIVGKNVTYTPIEATEVDRDLLLPYLGNQGVILTGKHAKLEFDVEMAGAGFAGEAPKYASLLRACGLDEALSFGTAAVYSIREDEVESATIFFEIDGVRHIMLGARGNLSINIAPKAIPHYRFEMTGLLGVISDEPLTAVTMTGWQTPLEASSANTTMDLHGWSSVAESLSINLGNTVTPRFLIGSESVIISDRKTTGQAVVEATSLATINWFVRALDRSRGALELIHGKIGGNIVQLDGPAVEIGKLTQGQTDNILNYTLPLSFCPVEGRDEFTITIR